MVKSEKSSSLVLRDDRIIETVAQLQRRINDRFPQSGLATLCGQLLSNAQQAAQRATSISKPIRSIRMVSVAITLSLLFVVVVSIVIGFQKARSADVYDVTEIVQTLDAVMNELILLTIAVIFFFSLETRLKRRRTLNAIHELRSIAHVIDMHQLTKDPERYLRGYADAKHSPKRTLTPQQLNRYLDYCSEMLSLTGKVAALYVQRFDDTASVNAVGEIEQLTTGLSRKIWQKIMILQQLRESTDWDASPQPTPVVTADSDASNHASPQEESND
ncbi:MAG: hypothetical protein AAGG48_02900 [Planctomycetota bacterium]